MRNQAEQTDLVVEETVVIESDGTETIITVTEGIVDTEGPAGAAADSPDSPVTEPSSSPAADQARFPPSSTRMGTGPRAAS